MGMSETWKLIKNSDGYEVSNLGRVRSFWGRGRYAQKDAKKPTILKLSNEMASLSLQRYIGSF